MGTPFLCMICQSTRYRKGPHCATGATGTSRKACGNVEDALQYFVLYRWVGRYTHSNEPDVM
jgi:hypothetical protein